MIAGGGAQPLQPGTASRERRLIVLAAIERTGKSRNHGIRFAVRCRWRFAARLHGVEPARSQIETCQTFIEDARRDRLFRRPERSKNVFGGMQHARHGGEVDNAGGSLQGMEGAKRSVQPFSVVRVFFKSHQIVDCLSDEFARFKEELFDELVHRGAPQKIAAYSASVSCLTGFTR